MKYNMNKKICILLLFLAKGVSPVVSQDIELKDPLNSNPYLQDYIREGLQSNQQLRQKQLDYAQSLAALKGARGLFFPDVSLQARYTVARGGRTIEFPIGDLLNPVYSTLNLLTMTDQFPQVENQEFPFLRPREQETKISLMQPVFSSDLIQNYRITREQAEITRISAEQYSRELVREISKAYYDYLKANSLKLLADTSLLLVEENLRVSLSLFENDKVTIDAVYRSEAELSRVEVQQAQARSMVEASRAYFNFLLNRTLDASVMLWEGPATPPFVDLDEATQMALENREELQQIKKGIELNQHVTALHRGSNIPGLFGVVDYGIQGEEYSFTEDDDFMIASLVMRWTLFQGSVNRQKVQESRIEGEKLDALLSQTRQQISLEVINNFYTLQAAYESVRAASKQERSARRAYELIDRKYTEGQASLLELIDARTSRIGASANHIIARSEYFSRLADFEYASGAAAGVDPGLKRERVDGGL
jgi:outer membrane protein